MAGIEDFLHDYTPVTDPETLAAMDNVRDLYASLYRALAWLPVNAERTAGMRLLVQAKDSHVRCIIDAEREGV